LPCAGGRGSAAPSRSSARAAGSAGGIGPDPRAPRARDGAGFQPRPARGARRRRAACASARAARTRASRSRRRSCGSGRGCASSASRRAASAPGTGAGPHGSAAATDAARRPRARLVPSLEPCVPLPLPLSNRPAVPLKLWPAIHWAIDSVRHAEAIFGHCGTQAPLPPLLPYSLLEYRAATPRGIREIYGQTCREYPTLRVRSGAAPGGLAALVFQRDAAVGQLLANAVGRRVVLALAGGLALGDLSVDPFFRDPRRAGLQEAHRLALQ